MPALQAWNPEFKYPHKKKKKESLINVTGKSGFLTAENWN
jgi:hypothetical protein